MDPAQRPYRNGFSEHCRIRAFAKKSMSQLSRLLMPRSAAAERALSIDRRTLDSTARSKAVGFGIPLQTGPLVWTACEAPTVRGTNGLFTKPRLGVF